LENASRQDRRREVHSISRCRGKCWPSSAWRHRYHAPGRRNSAIRLRNCEALDQVTEFIAVQRGDPMVPKERFLSFSAGTRARRRIETPGFLVAPDQPLGVLARPAPAEYISRRTYDDLLMRALKAQAQDTRRELCRWNKYVKKCKSVFDSTAGFILDENNPR